MRKIVIAIFALAPLFAFCQLGVSFHQSKLPFVGVNYGFKNKLRTELRISTDVYLEDISAEGALTYDFIKKSDYEFYGGIGLRASSETGGLAIPVGVNIYPLPFKQFGFHIELALILQESSIIRGSWGIRYKFKKAD